METMLQSICSSVYKLGCWSGVAMVARLHQYRYSLSAGHYCECLGFSNSWKKCVGLLYNPSRRALCHAVCKPRICHCKVSPFYCWTNIPCKAFWCFTFHVTSQAMLLQQSLPEPFVSAKRRPAKNNMKVYQLGFLQTVLLPSHIPSKECFCIAANFCQRIHAAGNAGTATKFPKERGLTYSGQREVPNP